MNTPTPDAPPAARRRVCACPDCLGLTADDSPLCEDCARIAGPAPLAAWQMARAELRAAVVSRETSVCAVWMRALIDCEKAAVRAAMGRARTLPADGYTGPLPSGACA